MSRLDEQTYREAEDALFAAYGVAAAEHDVTIPELGTSIRVLEIGTGDPVLFIHGSPNNAATWVPLAAAMTGRRCLLMERPGAGLSAPVVTWTDHRTQSTATVAGVLGHFDLAEVDLVGSSFGGLYAYNYTMAHPDRVRRLVQMGSPAGPTILGLPTIFRFLSLPLPKLLASKALRPDEAEARKMFGQIGHKAAVERGDIPDIVFTWYSSLLCNTDTAVHLLKEIRAIAGPLGYRRTARLDDEALGGITGPLSYLWGDEDPFAGSDRADELAALTPGATIDHFEGFGHVLWYDDTSRIAHRIEMLLESPDTERAS